MPDWARLSIALIQIFRLSHFLLTCVLSLLSFFSLSLSLSLFLVDVTATWKLWR